MREPTLKDIRAAAVWALEAGETPRPIGSKTRMYKQHHWDCDTSCCIWGAACHARGIPVSRGPGEYFYDCHPLVSDALYCSFTTPRQVIDIIDGKASHYGDTSFICGDVTNLSGNVSAIYGNVSNIRGNVTNLRGAVSSIYGDVSHLLGDVTNIAGDVSNITGYASHVRGDVSQLRGDVTAISGDVSNIAGDVSRLRGDVSQLHGDVTNLPSRATRRTLHKGKNNV